MSGSEILVPASSGGRGHDFRLSGRRQHGNPSGTDTVEEDSDGLPRHEQAAPLRRKGYARATGRAAFCMRQAAGSDELVTGIADASWIRAVGAITASAAGDDRAGRVSETDIYGMTCRW